MDLNRLTQKSQQALEEAQRLAGARNHQQLEPEHLLFALLSDPDGVVYPLLHAVGVSPRTLRDRVEEVLDRVPKVYGPPQGVKLSRAATDVLERALTEASGLTDEYVSTEHLLLAMLDSPPQVAGLFEEAGLTREKVLAALADVRGRQRVT